MVDLWNPDYLPVCCAADDCGHGPYMEVRIRTPASPPKDVAFEVRVWDTSSLPHNWDAFMLDDGHLLAHFVLASAVSAEDLDHDLTRLLLLALPKDRDYAWSNDLTIAWDAIFPLGAPSAFKAPASQKTYTQTFVQRAQALLRTCGRPDDPPEQPHVARKKRMSRRR